MQLPFGFSFMPKASLPKQLEETKAALVLTESD